MMTRIGRLLLSGLIALCSIAATCIIASPAMAQHACPSPGPNEQVVGMHDGGPGIGQLPLCVYRDQNQPPQQAPRPTAKWASIAWHVDVEQVWMEGNFDGPNGAAPQALAACQRMMGSGCVSIGEWRDSVVAIAQDWNGLLHGGFGADRDMAKSNALKDCRGEQPLPCEIVGTYSAGKIRSTPNLKLARKLYGAGAWVDDPRAPKGPMAFPLAWIATGHSSMAAATSAAISACEQANPDFKCSYFSVSGNGVVQTYLLNNVPSGLPERDAKRGAQAVRQYCLSIGAACVAQTAYDSRKPGLFVHDYRSPPKR